MVGNNDWRDYIAHHGTIGMRWGERNGPPYPLNRAKVYFKTGKMALDEYVRAKRLWNANQEIDLPPKEREHVYEEFDNNLTEKERGDAIVSRSIGGYDYTAIHKGHNEYKIIHKERIDKTISDGIIREVLAEVIGPDWEDYDDGPNHKEPYKSAIRKKS